MKALFKGYLNRIRERSNALYFKPGLQHPKNSMKINNRYLYAMLNTPKT